ncbi:hypothetical protein BKA70DRAFT_1289984 [Coprinopsis sp. MPI-PUGE-AT-0042]|nr:hypothetical protein BKA70DRAFT_1289984 [Coprinopsis sp. MPI-PUGE-AT-0042]
MSGTSTEIGWKLKVPVVEAMSPTYRHSFGELERKCCNTGKEPPTPLFPDAFIHFRIPVGGLMTLSDYVELTPENLDSIWQDEEPGQRSVQILFLLNRSNEDKPGERAQSVKWMAEHLGVSPCFFDGVFRTTDLTVLELPPQPMANIGEEGVSGVDDNLNGMYITSLAERWTTVWFSHQLDGMVSLYIVHDAGAVVIESIAAIVAEAFPLPFLGIDVLLLDGEKLFNENYHRMYEDALVALAKLNPADTPFRPAPKQPNSPTYSFADGQSDIILRYTAVFNVQRTYGNKRRIVELLKSLMATRNWLLEGKSHHVQRYRAYVQGGWKLDVAQTQQLIAIFENTLADREQNIKTSMELLGTLMNVRIAMYSAEMTREAKKDSSSMTTVSLLTMLFLPGSFVASFFSTSLVAFPGDKGTSTDSSEAMTSISDKIKLVSGSWLFFVITFCLTTSVFAVWMFYHGRYYYAVPFRLPMSRKRSNPANSDLV